MKHAPTAAQVHRYDQTHARRNVELDALILSYRDTQAEHGREPAVASVAHYLLREARHVDCAETLAIAVERLAAWAELEDAVKGPGPP